MSAAEVLRFPDLEAASLALAGRTADAVRRAVAGRGRCVLALAGGSTPRRAYEILAAMPGLPWEAVHLFLGDERCLSAGDPRSNRALVETALLVQAGPGRAAFHPLPEGAPEAAAAAYDAELRTVLGGGPLDLAILGLGGDGHTASLFPGSPLLEERDRLVAATPRPAGNPPVFRASLTLPALNAAREVLFLAAGAAKGEIVRRILDDPEAAALRYPAALVRPAGTLAWLLAGG
ncbi:MAG: 6-phosphogluconolactonase [Thermodesulfobacteriota bacterium]